MPSWFQSFRTAITTAYDDWSKEGGPFLAGSIAYFAVLAFFPLLLVVLSMTGWFLRTTEAGKDAESYILDTIGHQLSPVLESQVETVFAQVRNKASLGGPVGVITLITVIVALFTQIDAAFDRIWNVHRPYLGFWASVKHALVGRLRAFMMLSAPLIVIIVVFLSGMALATVEKVMGEQLPIPKGTTWVLQLVASFVLNAGVFSLIYYLLPNTHVPCALPFAAGFSPDSCGRSADKCSPCTSSASATKAPTASSARLSPSCSGAITQRLCSSSARKSPRWSARRCTPATATQKRSA